MIDPKKIDLPFFLLLFCCYFLLSLAHRGTVQALPVSSSAGMDAEKALNYKGIWVRPSKAPLDWP
jgi:hypothetical protein